MFHGWSKGFPPSVQVCPVQLPGRENRLMEAPFTRLSLLVQKLSQVLVHLMDVPYAFFGHSMGGLISFELIRELRRQQRPLPAHYFVSGNRAPQLANRTTPLHQLPEPLFVKEVVRRYNGIPAAVLQSEELTKIFVPVLKADVELIETYAYTGEEPLDCPITAFGGLQDSQVSQDELAAWRDQTHGAFTFRMFPGDHFYLNEARETLLRAISLELTSKLEGK